MRWRGGFDRGAVMPAGKRNSRLEARRNKGCDTEGKKISSVPKQNRRSCVSKI